VATYAKVLEVFPQFDPARIALARVYLDDPKQLEAAEKLATAARERLKNDPDLSGILAIINFRKGQFDYAAQLLKELSSKRPLTGGELFALGMSQAATKHPDEARAALTQALQAKLPAADAATAKTTLEKLEEAPAKK
jgi:Flp pilus assembly protein TadD